MQARSAAAVVLAMVASWGAAGCDKAPTAPDVPPSGQPPGPPARITVSGTVFEVTHELVRPLPDVRVVALTGWDIGDTSAITDAAGHYQITGLRDNRGRAIPLQSLAALKAKFSQPCRPTIDQWLAGSADEVNIYLVADEVLATRGVPAMLPVSGPVLSGTVVGRGGHREPVAGAEVALDFGQGFASVPAAGVRTVSDAAGGYMLCGLTQPYRVFWDEGGSDLPEGAANIFARRVSNGPLTRLHVDVRTLTQLNIEVD